MTIDKMREEFEAYRDKRNSQLEEEGHAPGSKWHVTNAHYPTWQASREALVIELPAENPLGSGPGDCEGGLPSFEQHCAAECNFILRDCREAIEAAGLKVKP